MKSNFELQKDVQDELKWQPMLREAEIGVTVKDGVVTLTGIVDSYAKKLAAEVEQGNLQSSDITEDMLSANISMAEQLVTPIGVVTVKFQLHEP